MLLTQVSFTQQCLSYFTVKILGLMDFNVTSPDIESGSSNFTVSLNDFMVDVCTPRLAIFHGNGIEESIKVDIQLPSGKRDMFSHQVSQLMLFFPTDCSTEATPSSGTVVSIGSVMSSSSAIVTPTIDPPHTEKSLTDIIPVIIAGIYICLLLTNNQSFIDNRMCVADCKIGRLRKEANCKQNSYMTLIWVHLTIHLMHPN